MLKWEKKPPCRCEKNKPIPNLHNTTITKHYIQKNTTTLCCKTNCPCHYYHHQKIFVKNTGEKCNITTYKISFLYSFFIYNKKINWQRPQQLLLRYLQFG